MEHLSSGLHVHLDRDIKGHLGLLFWALLVGALAGLVGGMFRLCLTRIDTVREQLLTWIRWPRA